MNVGNGSYLHPYCSNSQWEQSSSLRSERDESVRAPQGLSQKHRCLSESSIFLPSQYSAILLDCCKVTLPRKASGSLEWGTNRLSARKVQRSSAELADIGNTPVYAGMLELGHLELARQLARLGLQAHAIRWGSLHVVIHTSSSPKKQRGRTNRIPSFTK